MTQSSDDNPWQFEFRSDPGKVRELNEDSYFCDPSLGLWIVADGMGGHSSGEVASALAVETVKACVVAGESLVNAVEKAHEAILEAAAQDIGNDGMGTTIVVVKSDGIQYEVAWVGDSRVYLFNPFLEKLEQLTQDHSLVERLLSAGLISHDEAKVHPQRHLITQCLGSKELKSLKVDRLSQIWESGTTLLMCSDGLTEELSDAEMLELCMAQTELDVTANRMLRMALNKGGQDNITFVLLKSPVKAPKGVGAMIYKIKNNWRKLTSR